MMVEKELGEPVCVRCALLYAVGRDGPCRQRGVVSSTRATTERGCDDMSRGVGELRRLNGMASRMG